MECVEIAERRRPACALLRENVLQRGAAGIRPLAAQHDLVRVQHPAEIAVHRRVVEADRQDVVHGGAVSERRPWSIVRKTCPIGPDPLCSAGFMALVGVPSLLAPSRVSVAQGAGGC